MKLRKFEIDSDFEAMKDWITDERMHVMWLQGIRGYKRIMGRRKSLSDICDVSEVISSIIES